MIYENYGNLTDILLTIAAGLLAIGTFLPVIPKIQNGKRVSNICMALTVPSGIIAIFLPIALQHNIGLQTISDRITVSGTKVSIDALPDNISYNALEDDSGSLKHISRKERNTFQFEYDSKYEAGKLVTKEGYHYDLSYEDSQYLIERGASHDN